MLSQKTRYAIRAMQHLADHYGEGPVQLAAIAETQKIPAKFLTVILSELARSGLVESLRGRDGGYWL
ncbi:MAG: Rrf2 family transcriptional regulator, partial [Erythrobacter sp.]|nr:Rrf2 family transcriptional regulator [Erythrobacter sp.]